MRRCFSTPGAIVILPRNSGGGSKDALARSRKTIRREFCFDAMKVRRRAEKEQKGWCLLFRSRCLTSQIQKGKRNADRRVFNRSALLRQRIRRDALACRRSTSGVFLEMSGHLRPASGHASWDAAATITLLSGRYPPLPVPVQCAPHGRPGLPAADAQSRPGAVCNSARGHRPRSRTALCLRSRSFYRARITKGYVSAMVTRVNKMETSRLRAKPVTEAHDAIV